LLTRTSYLEKFRPQYHYSPESAWMNDPNGMVYFEGEYHLFYQHHPYSNRWGPMHWGHAISTDLVHWEQMPIALKPDHNGTIFSGSAVVDWNDTSGFFEGGKGLVAMFTQEDTNPITGAPRQRQSLAYSKDKGRTWTMYANNPVLTHEEMTDFRDPKVLWDEARERWVMVLAAGDRVIFYHSLNLIDWTFGSEFGLQEGSHAGVWECPDLFELPVDNDRHNRKWVLIVSIGSMPEYPEGSRTQYFIGSFDGERFVNDEQPENVNWLDHGRDNYAGVSWSDIPDQDGRRVFIGWMSNWKYANETPTDTWRSAMTLPRTLELRAFNDGIRLVQCPVDELKQLRIRSDEEHNAQLTQDPKSFIEADCYEIEAEFELQDAKEFGFAVRDRDGKQVTWIGYDTEKQTLFIDRSASGITDFNEEFSCRHEAPLSPVNGKVSMRLFVDWSSVEVFGNDGRVAMTDLIFPDQESRGVSFFMEGGSVDILSCKLYKLKSIW